MGEENSSIKECKLKLGDQVLVKNFTNDKSQPRFEGPYTIINLELENNRIRIENQRVIRWESLRNIKQFYPKEGEDVMPRQ